MIRNSMYTKYYSEIRSLAAKLNDLLEELPGCSDDETMEEEAIRGSIYQAADKLNDAKRAMDYFTRPTDEGYLEQNRNGRFEMNDHEFTSGSAIEVYLNEDKENHIKEGWYAGRVEYTRRDDQEGYYFYGANKPFLEYGMKARIRIK